MFLIYIHLTDLSYLLLARLSFSEAAETCDGCRRSFSVAEQGCAPSPAPRSLLTGQGLLELGLLVKAYLKYSSGSQSC